MDYLQNHCWCSESNWDNTHYDCRHVVSLRSYEDSDKEDWAEIVVSEDYFDEHRFDYFKKLLAEGGAYARLSIADHTRSISNLTPEVLTWLRLNVAERKSEDGPPEAGWCIGSARYRANDGSGMNIFFHRRKDAMAFIRMWSKWKKPVNYCQYFSDVRKTLNLDTGKYEVRQ